MASLPEREQILDLLDRTLSRLVEADPGEGTEPPPQIHAALERILKNEGSTVRDGLLVLLAMEVAHGEVIDWHAQGLYNPARWVSRQLGSEIYPRLHINGSSEALQTGVKGVSRYIDRSNAAWKEVLEWATEQDDTGSIEAAFLYLAAGIAATARNLPDLPPLDTPRITFARMASLIDQLLTTPSSGAFEQFFFAALLDAWHSQLEEPGVVETKTLNASDSSAGTAGDVQVRYRGQVTEAYEITAGGFEGKIQQAIRVLHRHDLRRVWIVATAVPNDAYAQLPDDLDIAVLDIRAEVVSLVSRLSKPGRRAALERLYEHLVHRQPRDKLVGAYVDALTASGVVEGR